MRPIIKSKCKFIFLFFFLCWAGIPLITYSQNNALHFDGVDDFVDCGNQPRFEMNRNSFTLEAWVYPDSFSPAINGMEPIFTKNEGSGNLPQWTFGYVTNYANFSNTLFFHSNDGSNSNWITPPNPCAIAINQWSHVAVTKDGNNYTFYVNGTSCGTSSNSNTIPAVNAPLKIGWTVSNFFWSGGIDEVRIWHSARTSSDLVNNQYTGFVGNEPNLAEYYQFNQGIAEGNNIGLDSLVSSMQSNGVNGALNTFSLNGPTSNWIGENCNFTLNSSSVNPSSVGGIDGSIDLLVGGGGGPFSYAWTGPSGFTASTEDISGLEAGIYEVIVSTGLGCTDTLSITLTDPQSIIACLGEVLTFTPATTGTNYSYSWDFGNGATSTTAISTHAYSNTGTYTVSLTVIDNNTGCATTTYHIVDIGEVIISQFTVIHNLCAGDQQGQATPIVSGGIPPYTYQWDVAAGNQTTATATGLGTGTYVVTVTDNIGCTATDSVFINQPNAFSLENTVVQNVSCFGATDGEAYVTPIGGSPPYSFQWPASASNQTTDTVSNLAPGTYNVVVTDANGCTDSTSVVITQPNLLVPIAITVNNASCFGVTDGLVTANPIGGTPPYSYSWNSSPIQNTQTATGLGEGMYVVTVTDSNGCTSLDSAYVSQPALLVATINVDNQVSCNGANDGQASISVTGGTTPYSYLWSTGATTSTVSNLAPGTYSITVTDSNGCSAIDSITITEPAALSGVTTSSNVSCNGSNDGSGTVTVSGGTAPYSYLWSNGHTGATLDTVAAGTYTVTVTDANGCTIIDSVTITQPIPLTVTVSVNESCTNSASGSASAVATGGTPTYLYSWNTGDITPTISNLAPGTYTITVTDFNGCSATDSGTINGLVAPNSGFSITR